MIFPLQHIFLKYEAISLHFLFPQVDVTHWSFNLPSPGYCWDWVSLLVYSPCLLFSSHLPIFLVGLVFHRHCFPDLGSSPVWAMCCKDLLPVCHCFCLLPFRYLLMTGSISLFFQYLFSRWFLWFFPHSPVFVSKFYFLNLYIVSKFVIFCVSLILNEGSLVWSLYLSNSVNGSSFALYVAYWVELWLDSWM